MTSHGFARMIRTLAPDRCSPMAVAAMIAIPAPVHRNDEFKWDRSSGSSASRVSRFMKRLPRLATSANVIAHLMPTHAAAVPPTVTPIRVQSARVKPLFPKRAGTAVEAERRRRAATSCERGAEATRKVDSGRTSSDGPHGAFESGPKAARIEVDASMFAAADRLRNAV